MNCEPVPTEKEIEADLRRQRDHPRKRKPADGHRWFSTEPDANGDRHCAICGGRDDRLVRDHCHDTGIIRGLICHSCNSWEGRCDSPALWAWRRTAPGLEVGKREFYTAPYHQPEGLVHSTIDELLTLPMSELLQRSQDAIEAMYQRAGHLAAESTKRGAA